MHRLVPLPFWRTKDLVDLDRVEREALQIGQRRIAGAEIVERQARAEIAQARQHLRGIFGIFHHEALGHFELQRARQHARARQHRLHVLQEVVAEQLAARHVDAGENRRIDLERVLPGGELARRPLQQRRRRDRRSGPVSSAIGMKSAGPSRPRRG